MNGTSSTTRRPASSAADGPRPRRARVPRRVRLRRTVAVLVALVALVGGFLLVGDLRSRAGIDLAMGERPVAAPCVAGSPARMTIPALSVDAPFEAVDVDHKAAPDGAGDAPLGTPVDPRKAGWFAAGPRPGSGVGTVLTDGHTSRDGSAIFQETLADTIAVGQQLDLVMDNGGTCSYVIAQVWRNVEAVHAYPDLVTSQGLYDQQGPERLFLATDGGPWLDEVRRFRDVNVVVATPIGR